MNPSPILIVLQVGPQLGPGRSVRGRRPPKSEGSSVRPLSLASPGRSSRQFPVLPQSGFSSFSHFRGRPQDPATGGGRHLRRREDRWKIDVRANFRGSGALGSQVMASERVQFLQKSSIWLLTDSVRGRWPRKFAGG